MGKGIDILAAAAIGFDDDVGVLFENDRTPDAEFFNARLFQKPPRRLAALGLGGGLDIAEKTSRAGLAFEIRVFLVPYLQDIPAFLSEFFRIDRGHRESCRQDHMTGFLKIGMTVSKIQTGGRDFFFDAVFGQKTNRRHMISHLLAKGSGIAHNGAANGARDSRRIVNPLQAAL